MTSPCGKIRIPINESSDDRSQIQEYLEQYRRRHSAHRAGGHGHLRTSWTRCASARSNCWTRRTLAELIEKRSPGHGEPVEELKKRKILIDGAPGGGLLLQIFYEDADRADLLRDHSAQGRRRFRRRQFQGALRVDGARPDPPRSAQARRMMESAGPRGDYAKAGPDYAVEQEGEYTRRSTRSTGASLRTPVEPRAALCVSRMDRGDRAAGCGAGDTALLDAISKKLKARPAGRSSPCRVLFPTTRSSPTSPTGAFRSRQWLRRPDEFDYIVEPDVFHDFFGMCRFSTAPTPTTYMNTVKGG